MAAKIIRDSSLAQNDNSVPGSTLQRITTSSVNLHHKLITWIDVAAVHAICIKRQSDVAVLIDRDQTACAAEHLHSVESRLRRRLQCHIAVFHQC